MLACAIVHWNTVYLDRAVRQLHAQGTTVPGDLLARIAPTKSSISGRLPGSDRPSKSPFGSDLSRKARIAA
jgi:hypothetical protein